MGFNPTGGMVTPVSSPTTTCELFGGGSRLPWKSHCVVA